MAKIADMIDDFTGRTQKDQELRERFTFLQKMAEGKSAQFKDELRVMLSNKSSSGAIEVVGDVAFEYRSGQHVNISNECDGSIMNAADEFFKGGAGLKSGFWLIVQAAVFVLAPFRRVPGGWKQRPPCGGGASE